MNHLPQMHDVPGVRSSARSGPGWARWLARLVFLLLLPCATAGAATVLQNVEFASLPGNQVQIDLVLSGATKAPEAFSTESPARIALDLQGVSSGLPSKTVPVGVGPVQSVVAVEAGDRTRVVINLNESVPYQVTTRGNRVTVGVNTQQAAPAPTAETQPVAAVTAQRASPARTPRPSASRGAPLRDVDFRRGDSGEGRVVVKLPDAGTRVAVREQGQHVLVDVFDTALPQRLFRRLDVGDFATPVSSIETTAKGRDVQIDIKSGTDFDYLAYQTDDLFTLEFRTLSKAEKEEGRKKEVVYSGDRLSLNFQDIEVRAVLQLLADFTGLNLVASDTVTGNITLRLKNVPWDQALDIILKTKGLTMRQQGNVVMIAPTAEVMERETTELKAARHIEEFEQLISEVIQIQYAKASKIADLLVGKTTAFKSTRSGEGSAAGAGIAPNLIEGGSFNGQVSGQRQETYVAQGVAENRLLSDRGSVTWDDRTNKLLVRDTARQLEAIRRFIAQLDIPVRQVMIEARVVIANNNFARELGVRFGAARWDINTNNGNYNEQSGGIDTGRNVTVGSYTVPDSAPLLVDLPTVSTPSGAVQFLLGNVGKYLVDLELSAMQKEGRGEIVSSPRVVTADQTQATIMVGQEIPYQQQTGGAAGGTNVAFKDALLQLDVKPAITPDDRINMELKVTKNEADFTRAIDGNPPINKREVRTTALVDNGETVVLGGVYERQKSSNAESVPWLRDIPVLGNLFKNSQKEDKNSELLIFVTPKILKAELGTPNRGYQESASADLDRKNMSKDLYRKTMSKQ